MSQSLHIYGIFKDGVCLYVGQTANLAKRKRQHELARSRFHSLLPWDFRVLDTGFSISEGARLERAWILKMKEAGQAEYNTDYGGTVAKPATHICIETGELFFGHDDLARHTGLCEGTVRSRLIHGRGILTHMTANYTQPVYDCAHFKPWKLGDPVEPVINYQI